MVTNNLQVAFHITIFNFAHPPMHITLQTNKQDGVSTAKDQAQLTLLPSPRCDVLHSLSLPTPTIGTFADCRFPVISYNPKDIRR